MAGLDPAILLMEAPCFPKRDHRDTRLRHGPVMTRYYAATAFPGHLHKSAMMHFSHKGLRATQV